jgi:uncharacterized protein YigE (DUF2233 family)
MKNQVKILLAVLLTSVILTGCGLTADSGIKNSTTQTTETETRQWHTVSEGLSYSSAHASTTEENENKDLLIVSINPAKYSFSIYQNKDKGSAKTIKEIGQDTKAIMAFNGGFFTEEFVPTGLLISSGQELRKISSADLLNGIFAVDKNGKPKILSSSAPVSASKYPFAIQNGPLLIDKNGQIQISKDTGKTASRTAIGIDKAGNVIIIVLKQSLLNVDNEISLYDFAHLLKDSPELATLNLHSVLNLDGGPSSGLIIGDQYYPEMEKVQNVILVKAK